jgi:hypothetical protein
MQTVRWKRRHSRETEGDELNPKQRRRRRRRRRQREHSEAPVCRVIRLLNTILNSPCRRIAHSAGGEEEGGERERERT